MSLIPTTTPTKRGRGNAIGMKPTKRTKALTPTGLRRSAGAKKAAATRAANKPAKAASKRATTVAGLPKPAKGGRTPTVEFIKDAKNEFRWHFKMNGRIMADSGEGYASHQSARRAFDKFAELVRTRPLNVLSA